MSEEIKTMRNVALAGHGGAGKTTLAEAMLFKAGVTKRLGKVDSFQPFTTGEQFTFAGFTIHPFATSHDTVDPVGFVVEYQDISLGFCTDTGMVSRLLQQRLAGCQGLILECNHDLKMLAEGPYPLHLQQRVRSRQGHLANNDAAQFLGDLLHGGLQHVVLAHLSETNNHPDLVTAQIRQELGHHNPAFSLELARQDQPGQLITVGKGKREGG